MIHTVREGGGGGGGREGGREGGSEGGRGEGGRGEKERGRGGKEGGGGRGESIVHILQYTNFTPYLHILAMYMYMFITSVSFNHSFERHHHSLCLLSNT